MNDVGNVPTAGTPAAPPIEARAERRAWSGDDIFVACFACMGIAGAVFLPLRYSSIPPITKSFLLATGLAALAYRFLGGIPSASFTVGALKLSGALAALVGIAMLVDSKMTAESPLAPSYQVWQVTGRIVDSANRKPIDGLLDGDISVEPTDYNLRSEVGEFDVTIHSTPDRNGTPMLPKLLINHPNFIRQVIDLNPGAKNEVDMARDGLKIQVDDIPLHHMGPYEPGYGALNH